ncbi:MAG: molybdopterin adenylyltransferase [Verrucomicrobia bacterium]|nr:molybdopterin adenylyltransferase [Verrucomicrobiota bacterium]
MKIGRITLSDRVSARIYDDRSGPSIDHVLREVFGADVEIEPILLPDDRERISDTLREMADVSGCDFIVTTGGTGIGPRDVTPEATLAVLEKELPGFGEILRFTAFEKVPTTILSRATAGIRGHSLIVNLPGKPEAVAGCLAILMPAIQEGLAFLRDEDPHALPTPP